MKPFVLASMLSVSSVFADGLPLTEDGKGIEATHMFAKIDESQREEIIAMGDITLTMQQWAAARKIDASCPKRIATVFPKDLNDCTCGAEGSAYVIHWDRDTIAVVFQGASAKASWEYVERLRDSGYADLSVDERGQFYHNGRLIPYSELLEVSGIKAAPNPRDVSGIDPFVGLRLPMGMDAESPMLKDRIKGLDERLRAFGWDFHTYQG